MSDNNKSKDQNTNKTTSTEKPSTTPIPGTVLKGQLLTNSEKTKTTKETLREKEG